MATALPLFALSNLRRSRRAQKHLLKRKPFLVVDVPPVPSNDQEGIPRKYKFLFEWQAGVFLFRVGCASPDNKKHTTGPKALCRDERGFLLRRAAYEKLASNSTGESAFVPLEFAQTAFAPGSQVIASLHLTLGQQKRSAAALIICMHSDRKLGGCISFEIND